MEILGIDIGGTGIKGAVVDVDKGTLVGERYRVRTPQPATPEGIVETSAQIVKHFGWQGRIGCDGTVECHGSMRAGKGACLVGRRWLGRRREARQIHGRTFFG